MILTFTPNPSIDQTLATSGALECGQVQRLQTVTNVAGGKGVNVAHACALAGVDTLALFPASEQDPFLSYIADDEVPFRELPGGTVRINTAITEPDGTTTKLNGPGSPLSEEQARGVRDALIDAAGSASWLVMAGSLPPGAPQDLYTQLIREVREAHPNVRIAVDTSDGPLAQLAANLGSAAPDLMKPNGEELGSLVGRGSLEGAELREIVDAARDLGVTEVLVTLGGDGAVLVTPEGAWHAEAPEITIVSTVGAGDSALAGYLMAREQGASYAESLSRAVAYGSAATSLPGTTIPNPHQVTATPRVTELTV